MKIYAAAIYTNNLELNGPTYNRLTPRERGSRGAVRYILESYHYIKDSKFVNAIRRDGIRVFLDSGAFSAFASGSVIDLDAFIYYIKKNKDIVDQISVLDVIGDAQKTYDNQVYMEKHGIRPLPCFHFGEDERWLEHYVQRYDYISLGMGNASQAARKSWLDHIWSDHLCDAQGRSKVKVHGFALTRLDLMLRYPWYSVDSTSWLQAGANGLLILPPDGRKFPVSVDSPSRRTPNQHFNTISETEQWAVYNIVNDRGFDFNRCQNTYLARWMFNLAALDEINTTLEQKHLTGADTFRNQQLGVFQK